MSVIRGCDGNKAGRRAVVVGVVILLLGQCFFLFFSFLFLH